jgi:FkbM family methyltransferase
MDYERAPIYLNVDSWIEHDFRLHSCQKELDTVEWIESWFKPGDVFYDIGANVGAYSLVAFRFLKGRVKIYAFEPGFVTFPQLCRNIHLNNAAGGITPFQVALFDQTGLAAFHYQNLTTGGALHSLGAPIDQHGQEFQSVFTLLTLSYRLDEFVQQFGLPFPNHIKIDVDGNELQILKGAGDVLRHPELRCILLEVNEEHEGSDDMVRLLEANGFVLHRRANANSLYCRR